MMAQIDVCWLDYSPNDGIDSVRISKQLESIAAPVHKFSTLQEYQTYLDQIGETRVLLVVPSSVAKEIIEKYHDRPQTMAICVLNMGSDPEKGEDFKELSSEKLIKVQTSIDNFIERWMQYQRIHEPVLATPLEEQKAGQTSRNMDGGFLHFRRLIDVLLRIPTKVQDRMDFIRHLRHAHQTNKKTLEIVDRFEQTYRKEEVLHWYTAETIIYRDLNLALRQQDIPSIERFASIIRDLDEQIRSLGHQQQKNKMHLFRSQWMSKMELDRIRQSLGKFISINSFFSTSVSSLIASMFAAPLGFADDTREQVLWEIEVDPEMFERPSFADISWNSHFPEEQEILFTINNIFKVQSITDSVSQQTKIRLTLYDPDNHELRNAYDHLQNSQDDGIFALGDALRDMGRLDDAARVYAQVPANQLPDFYNRLGMIEAQRANFAVSIQYFEQALTVVPDDEPLLTAAICNNLGNAYENLDKKTMALFCYAKAVSIYKRIDGTDHYLDYSQCFNNIGASYAKMQDYNEALKNFTVALKLQLTHCSNDHPDIALSYMNLCNAYADLGQYDRVIDYYDRSLTLYLTSVPSDHPELIRLYINMIRTFEEIGDHTRALAIKQKLRSITCQCPENAKEEAR